MFNILGEIKMTDTESPRVLFVVPGSHFMAYQDRILRERRGCESDIVQRGGIALEQATSKKYDLIFVYGLGVVPGENPRLVQAYDLLKGESIGNLIAVGSELVRMIRESGINKDTPIVVHGLNDDGRNELLTAGADEWVDRLGIDQVVEVFDRYVPR